MKKLTIALSAMLIILTAYTQAQSQTHKSKVKKASAKTTAPKQAPVRSAPAKAEVKPANDDYQNALGLKVLYGVAVTGKHFFNQNGAVEAIVNFRSYSGIGNEFNLSAMYEYHQKIDVVPGLKWYLGGGGYVGHYSYDFGYDDIYGISTSFGVTAVAGLEYKFNNLPIAISADWQPVILLNRNSGFAADNGGIGVKYTF